MDYEGKDIQNYKIPLKLEGELKGFNSLFVVVYTHHNQKDILTEMPTDNTPPTATRKKIMQV